MPAVLPEVLRTRLRRRGCRRRSERRGRCSAPYASTARDRGSLAPAMIAPAAADARISAPGLPRVHRAQAVGVERLRAPGRDRLRDRSPGRRPCPSARRFGDEPDDAQLPLRRRRRVAGPRGSRASSANASVSRPSPARIAIASPWTTCRSAGRAAACRCPSPADRRGSASRCGSTRSRRRPAAPARCASSGARSPALAHASAAARTSIGRSRLPPREQAVAHRVARARRARRRGRRGSARAPRRRRRAALSSHASSAGGRVTAVRSSPSRPSDAGAGCSSPRSLRISMRRSAASSLA